MREYVYVDVYVCEYVYVGVCLYMRKCESMIVYKCRCVGVMCINVCMFMYIYVYVYMYM